MAADDGLEGTFFAGVSVPTKRVAEISPRLLAHLGDAVFHLFERERDILKAGSVQELHRKARVDANAQAQLLDALKGELSVAELEIVRRARNVKPTASRRAEQASYRKATAFEALLGYLYLTNQARLRQLLALTLDSAPG